MIDPNSTHLTEIEGVKGGQPQRVFKRSAVLSLKSIENYLRMGRRVKSNEIPLKFVKSRSVTIAKKRIEEAAVLEGQVPNEQELYSFAQTELYIADPIVDVSGTFLI